LPYFADLYPPPPGYEWRTYTFIPTDERVGSGYPSCGWAVWMVPLRSKSSYLPCFDYREMLAMKQYLIENQGGKPWKGGSKDPFLKDLPTINQLCTDTLWEETKKPRQPCTLKLRFGDGQASVIISDEAQRCSITTTSDTIREALELLEAALAAGKVAWRPWGDFEKKRK